MSALMAGQGVMEVAAQFKLPESTVRHIKARIPQEKLAEVGAKKQTDFGELLSDYLHETLVTLRAQAEFFRNETWLSKQPASDVAVLHGVQADKALRLLEAIERAHTITEDDTQPQPS